jgi:hypothetical protein
MTKTTWLLPYECVLLMNRYGRNWAWMNNRIVPSEVAKGFGVGSKALGIEPLSAELARENDAWQVRMH